MKRVAFVFSLKKKKKTYISPKERRYPIHETCNGSIQSRSFAALSQRNSSPYEMAAAAASLP
jgi:hypothetical protein